MPTFTAKKNLLEIKPSDDPMERVRLLARALAYGVIQGKWLPSFYFSIRAGGKDARGRHELVSSDQYYSDYHGRAYHERKLRTYLKSVWQDRYPHALFLAAFGYFERLGGNTFILTQKAFDLLAEPLFSKVFISYRRRESSAFALLICDRLRRDSFKAFLDVQDIQPGDTWHARVESQIEKSDYFVCLLGNTTLDSALVRQEIKWALRHKKMIVPIWHNGFKGQVEAGEDIQQKMAHHLGKMNAIIVNQENVLAYENAIRQLLQFLHIPQDTTPPPPSIGTEQVEMPAITG